ncbi:MAG TPA: Smr/MutS family protein [Spirochaetia bacterium]|nr:Smr/MutS family protein [Spirochaetia bacterium]
MDFARILDTWENRGDRRSKEPFDKDAAAPAPAVLPSRAEMERSGIDDELDLHGQLAEEAVASLRFFLRESRLGGMKKVLVIHGKGLHSENRKAVLKEAVQQVLVKDKNVAAWGEAGRKDGGRGASWVWLKTR